MRIAALVAKSDQLKMLSYLIDPQGEGQKGQEANRRHVKLGE